MSGFPRCADIFWPHDVKWVSSCEVDVKSRLFSYFWPFMHCSFRAISSLWNLKEAMLSCDTILVVLSVGGAAVQSAGAHLQRRRNITRMTGSTPVPLSPREMVGT